MNETFENALKQAILTPEERLEKVNRLLDDVENADIICNGRGTIHRNDEPMRKKLY